MQSFLPVEAEISVTRKCERTEKWTDGRTDKVIAI